MPLSSEQVLPNLLAARWADNSTYLLDVGGRAACYRQTEVAVEAWSRVLAAQDVTVGDRVVVMMPNSFECLYVWMALARLAATETPLNTDYVGGMLAHAVNLVGARVAVVHQRYLPRFEALRADICRLQTIVVVGEGESQSTGFDIVRAESALESVSGAPEVPHREVAPHETACIVFTSGTTGPSKGVVVAWAQLHAMTEGLMPSRDLNGSDVWYSPFPTFHASGKVPLYSAALVHVPVVMRERFSISQFWPDVRAHGVTTLMTMGTILAWLWNQPPAPDDAQNPLRNMLMAPMPEHPQAFFERYGVRGRTIFNMTELSCPVVSDWGGVPAGSCGRLREGYEVRIVDDFDNEVPSGTLGEIIVRSDEPWLLNQGYWGMPEATATAWRNGWFHTGDLGKCDADGWFYYLDRKKDAMRVRGENVSSVEVEAEVVAFAPVCEAAVVGVPCPDGEEDIAVFVVPQPGGVVDPEELLAYLEDRCPAFMHPRFVCVVEKLPKTPTEKVRKQVLRSEWGRWPAWERSPSLPRGSAKSVDHE